MKEEVPGVIFSSGVSHPGSIRRGVGKRLRVPPVGRAGGIRGRVYVVVVLGQRVCRADRFADGGIVFEWTGRPGATNPLVLDPTALTPDGSML